MHVEPVVTAWRRVETWLRESARTSAESMLPPAAHKDVTKAEEPLRQYAGYGFPQELTALWRVCGGVENLEIEEDQDEGEVASGDFLPDGVLLGPALSTQPRISFPESDPWGAEQWVAWLSTDEEVIPGLYISDDPAMRGVGRWSTLDGNYELGEPQFPSIASSFEKVLETLQQGPATLMGPTNVPGIIYGWLHWDSPEEPSLLASENWVRLH
ncbi:hypothetical protein [Streptomyces sp. KL118A]|uniref:hypothetical protein n=1 Tax=Streptomyces sp. KL118A TaxID=3045153 RepID=UPI00278C11D0|nr:hypothetical protein [Streptomyces sp. KL118A]